MYFLDLTLPSAEANLALDEALLLAAEDGRGGEVLRLGGGAVPGNRPAGETPFPAPPRPPAVRLRLGPPRALPAAAGAAAGVPRRPRSPGLRHEPAVPGIGATPPTKGSVAGRRGTPLVA